MIVLFIRLLLCSTTLAFLSCELTHSPTEQSIRPYKQVNSPVKINQEAIPKFDKTENAETVGASLTKDRKSITQPQRKYKFRTPNLVDALPNMNEATQNPAFEIAPQIDNDVEEASVIRATE